MLHLKQTMKGKDFLKLLDVSAEEIQELVDLAAGFKALKKAGIPHKYFEGKNIALIFEKSSTRTRCSFEVAGHDLGMHVTYLDAGSQLGKKESIPDTARVLSTMFDGIEYRRSWPATPPFPCGTASPTRLTPPRSWRIFSLSRNASAR